MKPNEDGEVHYLISPSKEGELKLAIYRNVDGEMKAIGSRILIIEK